jgi:6,7-dimethyl-8-ribityllumazine synthase
LFRVSPSQFNTGDTEITEESKLKIENVPEAEFPSVEGKLDASGKRFAIVVPRFNAFITERLLLSACDGLLRCGASKKDIAVVRVPGSFEIPPTARALALTKKYDAIICLGCLLRGDTAHYDVIVNEVTRGIGQSAQETGVPHAFGVLTCDTLEQAIDRAGLKMGNKGFDAALAAVEMASLNRGIRAQGSGGRKGSSGRSSSGREASTPDERRVPRRSSSAQHDKSRKKSR